jgi:hypothetical protein
MKITSLFNLTQVGDAKEAVELRKKKEGWKKVKDENRRERFHLKFQRFFFSSKSK